MFYSTGFFNGKMKFLIDSLILSIPDTTISGLMAGRFKYEVKSYLTNLFKIY